MEITSSQKLEIRFILAGVLMNGYSQGIQKNELILDVLDIAGEELYKLLSKKYE